MAMYSQGCSAGVQLATAVVVPHACAPSAHHPLRTRCAPVRNHLCTTCAAGLYSKGWDPL